MDDVGASFGWAFKDPDWLRKFVVISLIGIIPILGQINLYGWMLACLDNMRAGYPVLPEANFDHLGRGGRVFVVLIVYGFAVAIPLVIVFFVFFGAMLASTTTSPTGETGPSPVFFPFFNLLTLPIFLLITVFQLFYPAIILNTDRGGISAGLNVGRVWGTFRSRTGPSFLAGVLFIVAGDTSGFGVYACCVGLLFSLAYGQTIIAGVLASYERALGWPPPAYIRPYYYPPPPGYPPQPPPPGYPPAPPPPATGY